VSDRQPLVWADLKLSKTQYGVTNFDFWNWGPKYPDLLLHLTSLRTSGILGAYRQVSYNLPPNLKRFQTAHETFVNEAFKSSMFYFTQVFVQVSYCYSLDGAIFRNLTELYLNGYIRADSMNNLALYCGTTLKRLGFGFDSISSTIASLVFKVTMFNNVVVVVVFFFFAEISPAVLEGFSGVEVLELGGTNHCQFGMPTPTRDLPKLPNSFLVHASKHLKKLKVLYFASVRLVSPTHPDPDLEDFPCLHTVRYVSELHVTMLC